MVGLGDWSYLIFFLLYYCMIKSAEYVRFRLYPPDSVLPLIDNELARGRTSSTKTTETTNDEREDWQSPA